MIRLTFTRSARFAFIVLIGLSLMDNTFADDETCANPVARPGRGASKSIRDEPVARGQWFLNGRKVSTIGLAGGEVPITPARRLLRAYQQSRQMPRRPGLAGAPASWIPVGSSVQSSLYWGKVSGRVTSVAVDNRGQNQVLYVGTAFGGLWRSDDYRAPSPHFISVGDSDWPSLAVGSIAIDTSHGSAQLPTIYVGTGEANDSLDSYYGVGILKSTDGGQSWALSTGKGAFVGLASSALYDLDGPFVGAAISKILVDPANADHLIIAVSTSPLGTNQSPKTAIYESNHAGDSWQPMLLAGVTQYNATDIIYEPVKRAFYAAVQGLGVFRLATGGTEWKPTASPFGSTAVDNTNFYRASLAAREENGSPNIYAVISAGYFADNDPRNYNLSSPNSNATGMVRSNNDGSSWTPVSAPNGLFGDGQGDGQGSYDQWIAAPDGSQRILVGGLDIWSVASTSSPWANLSNAYDWAGGLADPQRHIHSDQHAIAILDSNSWIVGNDGGVWSTEDAGSTWTDLNTDISSMQLMSLTPLLPTGQGYIFGAQDNGTMLGGSAGAPWMTTLTGDGGFTLGNPQQPAQYFTERFNISLCRSDDSGQHWKTLVDGNTISDASAFYVPYTLVRGNPDKVVLGAQRVWLGDAVPQSAGAGWRAISAVFMQNGVIQSIASAPSSPKTIYITATNGLTNDSLVYFNNDVLAQNSSQNWKATKKVGLPSNRLYSTIAIDPKNPKIAYLGVQGFGTGHVFRTDNNGAAWHDVTPFLVMDNQRVQIDTPVNCILIDPLFPSTLYVATDVGVFVSTDSGVSWQPHGTSLPRTAILELKMSADRKVVAATHGRGAWQIDPLSH